MSEQNNPTVPAASATPARIRLLTAHPVNLRRRLIIGFFLAWLCVWVLMALSLTLTPPIPGTGRGVITADARSQYTYFLVVIPLGTALFIATVVGLVYRSATIMKRILPLHLAALVLWFVLHLMMINQFNNPLFIAGTSALLTVFLLLITLLLPIWPVELKPGHIYYHKRAGTNDDAFDFVTRSLPRIDQRLLVQLAQAGLPPDGLRLYLNWGAPVFLRDHLSGLLLTQYYNELNALHTQHPRYFPPLEFKPDTHNISFMQENLRYMLGEYQRSIQQAINELKGQITALKAQAASHTPSARPTPDPRLLALQQQQAEAQQAQERVRDLQRHYASDTHLLVELFAMSSDPQRAPEPLHWITAVDTWRLLWNKAETVLVKVTLDRVYTRDSMVFRLDVSCVCTFEPDLVDDPQERLKLRNKGSEEALREYVSTTVTNYITQAARQLFQVMPTREALETGLDTFRRQLAPDFNTAKAKKQLKMLEGTVDCQLIIDERVITSRIGEIEDERELVRLKKLLEMGRMPIDMQAETLMRILMLRNMPDNLQQFPGETFNARSTLPSATAVAMPPLLPGVHVPPALPAGEDITVLPLELVGEPTVPDDAQNRRRARLTDLDEAMDTREDDDNPNTYSPRR